jgi:hypothetical protein
MSNIEKVNEVVDKAQIEVANIQSSGFKTYIFTKKVNISLLNFLIVVAATFIAGAILF